MEKSSDILTKEQILIATEDTLRRFGVTKSSVTDVAKVLGVSHGTIYRHFKSKAELLEGVTEKWLNEKIIDPLTEICQDSSVLGISHLKRYIQTLVELKQYYARDDEEMFEMYTRVTEQAANLIDQHIAHIVDQLADIIVRGVSQRISRPNWRVRFSMPQPVFIIPHMLMNGRIRRLIRSLQKCGCF